MSHKHRPTPSKRGASDLQLIKGIGPVLARRLKRAGIRSFAQLATRSPAQLAKHVPGISAAQVLRFGWIEQANKLAQAFDEFGGDSSYGTPKKTSRQTHKSSATALRDPPTATEDSEINANHQYYATFTVQLLLNDDDSIRRMRVVHVQSGVELIDAGWDEARLIAFIVQHVKLHFRNRPN